MQRGQVTADARRALDRRLSELKGLDALNVPHRGWITAIRSSLGMSQRDLARRPSVSGAAVAKLEAAERSGGTLATLQQVANALDCDLGDALVPRSSLAETLDRESHAVARPLIGPVATTMALEHRSGDARREADVVEDIAADLVARNRAWR